MKYELSYPDEPVVGTIVKSETGARFKRFADDDPAKPGGNPWVQLDSDGSPLTGAQTRTWPALLRAHPAGLTDVTPVRTWEMPEMPEVGTRLLGVDMDGEPREYVVRSLYPLNGARVYTDDGQAFSWRWALHFFGPLTEVR